MLLSNTPFHRIHHPHRDRSHKRRRRFLAVIAEGLRSAQGCRFLGKDGKTARLLEHHGVPAAEIGINRVSVGDQILHVLAVPNWIWYCREASKNLHQAQMAAENQGQRWLTLPQRAVESVTLKGDIRPREFFDVILDRALKKGLNIESFCRDNYHDPNGCFAMRLATGASCHH